MTAGPGRLGRVAVLVAAVLLAPSLAGAGEPPGDNEGAESAAHGDQAARNTLPSGRVDCRRDDENDKRQATDGCRDDQIRK